ncbi:TrmH family RNA methyltransferase [Vibrio nigripulchritudo]|uniref:TrmH family RNA methyltransferase n=1 Tax=Vibrio nigripulchritudo TaxID=28173 RepID=UPI0005FA40F2|nr:TrmH family RNA methyltransferase [Vibrio nigripulchritudo]KJY76910.1 rRNA methyltransferase [Vibrio nigripulchritudo]
MAENIGTKSALRKRADEVKDFRCKNLIVVLENPKTLKNIGSVVRNVNALGAEKVYIVDENGSLPDDWQDMRHWNPLVKPSASAVKWSFVKKFSSTQSCLAHLESNKFDSIATSPHVKGKMNVELSKGDYTQKRLAVWFGNESKGLSELAIQSSVFCVNIPMFGIIESLNLGTSSGIVLYEITKQRREFQNRKYGRI